MSKKTNLSKIGNSRVLWIIVSIVLAFFLWVYVTIDEGEYTETFDGVKVVYNGEEALREAQGLIVTELSRNDVSVTLKGSRREIAKLKKTDIQAVIDLSTISRPGTNTNYYYSISFLKDVDENFVSVESQMPRTVSFTVDRYSYKYVEVKGVFNGSVAEGFKADVSDMQFEPATIRISGPEEEISAVDSALVVLERNDVDGTIRADIGYTLQDRNGDTIQLGTMVTDTDTVNVTLPVAAVKTVPLVVDLVHGAGTTEANVKLVCEPQEILISGDPNLLKGINRITLDTLDLTEFNSTYEETYQIILPNDVINESGVNEAKVNVKLTGLLTKRMSVTNLVPTNVPEGYVAEVTTKSIDVTLRAPESVINEIKSSNLSAILDLSDYSGNEGQYTVPAVIRVDGFSGAGILRAQEYNALVQIKRED